MEAISVTVTVVMRTSHRLVAGVSSCVEGLSLNSCLTPSYLRLSNVVPVLGTELMGKDLVWC